MKRQAVLLAMLYCLTALTAEAQTSDANRTRGSISSRTYLNLALGMTIPLPEGSWQFQPGAPAGGEKRDPKCKGPLCGPPEVNIALESRKDGALFHAIFLGGYKLEKECLDRHRYPLRLFAVSMITGSLHGSGWTPTEEISLISLDGHPAYRQRVTKADGQTGFGYVSESNGFVFLLVGTGISSPDQLQKAIEGMKFAK